MKENCQTNIIWHIEHHVHLNLVSLSSFYCRVLHVCVHSSFSIMHKDHNVAASVTFVTSYENQLETVTSLKNCLCKLQLAAVS